MASIEDQTNISLLPPQTDGQSERITIPGTVSRLYCGVVNRKNGHPSLPLAQTPGILGQTHPSRKGQNPFRADPRYVRRTLNLKRQISPTSTTATPSKMQGTNPTRTKTNPERCSKIQVQMRSKLEIKYGWKDEIKRIMTQEIIPKPIWTFDVVAKISHVPTRSVSLNRGIHDGFTHPSHP